MRRLTILDLAAIEIIDRFLQNVKFCYPATPAAEVTSIVTTDLSRLLKTWPEPCKSAEDKCTSVTLNAFMGKSIPEEQDERKCNWNPWPVLGFGEVSRVEKNYLIPYDWIVDSVPGIGNERLSDIGIEEVAQDRKVDDQEHRRQ